MCNVERNLEFVHLNFPDSRRTGKPSVAAQISDDDLGIDRQRLKHGQHQERRFLKRETRSMSLFGVVRVSISIPLCTGWREERMNAAM